MTGKKIKGNSFVDKIGAYDISATPSGDHCSFGSVESSMKLMFQI